LSLRLWDKDEQGQTWEYIYFINQLKDLDLDYTTFNEIADNNG